MAALIWVWKVFKNRQSLQVDGIKRNPKLSPLETLLWALLSGVALIGIQLPPTLDELYSFNYFISQPWVVTALHYPEPNNHVLQNILAKVFYEIGLDFPLAGRLFAWLANTIVLGILLAYKQQKSFFSYLLILTYALLEGSLFFASVGRGYSLFALLLVLLWLVKEKRWVIIVSVLGCLIIPVFFLPLCLLISIEYLHSKGGKKLNTLLLLGFIFSLLAYLPLWVINGNRILFNNWTLPSEASKNLSFSLVDYLNYLTKLPNTLIVVLLALGLTYFLIFSRKLSFSFSLPVLTLIILGGTPLPTPVRALFPLTALMLLQYLLQSENANSKPLWKIVSMVPILMLVIMLNLNSYFQDYQQRSKGHDGQLYVLSKQLLSIPKQENIYLSNNDYLLLSYIAQKRMKPVHGPKLVYELDKATYYFEENSKLSSLDSNSTFGVIKKRP